MVLQMRKCIQYGNDTLLQGRLYYVLAGSHITSQHTFQMRNGLEHARLETSRYISTTCHWLRLLTRINLINNNHHEHVRRLSYFLRRLAETTPPLYQLAKSRNPHHTSVLNTYLNEIILLLCLNRKMIRGWVNSTSVRADIWNFQ